jgi:dTDP-4-amino-4,6-dideoxygalactose transaminase
VAETKIPFARVVCSGNELEYVRQVLESGWLTTAGKAGEFEKKFAVQVGARRALAVNSCTSALHLGLEALGLKPGDEVIVPALTFAASAETVRYLGAEPVICDVDGRTGLLRPETVAAIAAGRPKVKAVMPVHYGGQSVRMFADAQGPGLMEVARAYGLKIVEDAAHAFPARYQADAGPVGSLEETVCCFSFYANKTITTAEGGMLTSGSEDVLRRASVMRLHGIDRDVWARFTSAKPSWRYDVVAPGYKYNLPDVLAAIGLAQLEQAAAWRLARENIARRYYEALGRLEALDLLQLRSGLSPADHSWHLFPVILKPEARLGRDEFIERLAERGIGASVHYCPLYRLRYYRERYGLDPADFPETEKIWAGTVSLPIYPSLTADETEYVCLTVAELLGG